MGQDFFDIQYIWNNLREITHGLAAAELMVAWLNFKGEMGTNLLYFCPGFLPLNLQVGAAAVVWKTSGVSPPPLHPPQWAFYVFMIFFNDIVVVVADEASGVRNKEGRLIC